MYSETVSKDLVGSKSRLRQHPVFVDPRRTEIKRHKSELFARSTSRSETKSISVRVNCLLNARPLLFPIG